MKKKLFAIPGLCALLLLNSAGYAADITYKDFSLEHEIVSAVEFEGAENSIPVFSTEFGLNLENSRGLSADFLGSLEDKIDEIDGRDFQLEKFIKELNVNYQIKTDDAVLLLSVGKMPSGVKIDNDDIREESGVMGVRLSISPEKIPLIQDWLTKNKFKINRIDITRYNDGSRDRLDLRDLSETNMTSYALFLSRGHNLQTFFVYKTPDKGHAHGVTSASLGAVYMMKGELKPQFFILKHKSKASFMDLDLMVVSAGIELAPTVRSTYSYSNAYESVSGMKKNTYDFSVSKELKKTKNVSLDATVGVKVERGTEGDNRVVYMRLEARF